MKLCRFGEVRGEVGEISSLSDLESSGTMNRSRSEEHGRALCHMYGYLPFLPTGYLMTELINMNPRSLREMRLGRKAIRPRPVALHRKQYLFQLVMPAGE